MTTYIIRRLIQALIALFIVSLLVFFILRLLPGDPIIIYIGEDEFTDSSPERLEALRAEFGLDKPIMVQYFNWIVDVLHGNLPMSVRYRVNP